MDAPVFATLRDGRTVSVPKKSAESIARMQEKNRARNSAPTVRINRAFQAYDSSRQIIARKRRDERIDARDMMRNSDPSALKRAFC